MSQRPSSSRGRRFRVRARLNPNLAKIHRTYSVQEVAEIFGIHKNTVREWLKGGLAVIDSGRPSLIDGAELRRYLAHRRRVNQRHCEPGQLFCLRCREPRKPADGLVEYRPLTNQTGSISGVCSVCDLKMNRIISASQVEGLRGLLHVRTSQGPLHLTESK
jgi:excisionase family DNA binding protein